MRDQKMYHQILLCPIRLLASLFFCLSHISCAPPIPEMQSKDTQKTEKTYRINLPKSIDLDALIPPLYLNNDPNSGIFMVDGILMQPDQFWESEVTITGYITEKTKCPRRAKFCDQPALWLAKAPGQAKDRIRVADLTRKQVARFKKDKPYRITGIWSQMSESGYVNTGGLLKYKSHTREK